jgi:hypothetical protein
LREGNGRRGEGREGGERDLPTAKLRRGGDGDGEDGINYLIEL